MNFRFQISDFRFRIDWTETERVMRKFVVIAIVVLVAGGAAAYFGGFFRGDAALAE